MVLGGSGKQGVILVFRFLEFCLLAVFLQYLLPQACGARQVACPLFGNAVFGRVLPGVNVTVRELCFPRTKAEQL